MAAKTKTAKTKTAKPKTEERLSARQKTYVAARVAGMTAPDAAAEAGLANPPHKAKVRRAIAAGMTQRLDALGITADDVVRRLAQIAFADVVDVVQVEEYQDRTLLEVDPDDPDVARPAGNCRVRIASTDTWGEQHRAACTQVRQGKDGIVVEFGSQIKALEILAKHFGVTEEKPTLAVDNLVVVPAKNGDMDDWEKQAKAARELSLSRMKQQIG